MNLSLKSAFCISFLVHGALFSIISRACTGSQTMPQVPQQGITLEILSEPNGVAPVVSVVPLPAAVEPRIVSESVPLETATAPLPAELPKPMSDNVAVTPILPVKNLAPLEETPLAKIAMEAASVSAAVAIPTPTSPFVHEEPQGCQAAYLFNPKPVYPKEARKLRLEGLVILNVQVTSEGKPCCIELLQSSGHALLDEAALQAVRRWQFAPARIGSLAVISRVEIPIRFKLSG